MAMSVAFVLMITDGQDTQKRAEGLRQADNAIGPAWRRCSAMASILAMLASTSLSARKQPCPEKPGVGGSKIAAAFGLGQQFYEAVPLTGEHSPHVPGDPLRLPPPP